MFNNSHRQESQAFRSEPLPDGFRWVLPRRDLGLIRKFAWIPLLFGLLITLVCLFMLGGAVLPIVRGGGVASGIGNVVFVGAFTFVGLTLTAIGLALRGGWARIEIGRRRIRLIERAGPFWWSWSRPADQLRRFKVHREPVKINGQPVFTGPLSDLGYIHAEFQAPFKPLALAVGYPGELVLQLAEQLAQHSRTVAPPGLFEHHGELVEIVGSSEPSVEQSEITVEKEGGEVFGVRRPESSDIVLVENTDGVSLTIPPVGIWTEKMGMAKLGVFWCILTGLFTVGMFFSNQRVGWGAIPFLGIFWGVGIVMLVIGVNMGGRRAIIDVVGGTLLVTQQNLFGTKQNEWRCDEIATIKSGSSGMSVNDRPVMELQVLPANGSKVGMFAGRDIDELNWIADVLRRSTGAHARGS